MITILVLNSKDDEYKLECIGKAESMARTLRELRDYLRENVKYGNFAGDVCETWDKIYEELFIIADGNNLDVTEL